VPRRLVEEDVAVGSLSSAGTWLLEGEGGHVAPRAAEGRGSWGGEARMSTWKGKDSAGTRPASAGTAETVVRSTGKRKSSPKSPYRETIGSSSSGCRRAGVRLLGQDVVSVSAGAVGPVPAASPVEGDVGGLDVDENSCGKRAPPANMLIGPGGRSATRDRVEGDAEAGQWLTRRSKAQRHGATLNPAPP
jgi:hypothetical protein